MNGVVLLLAYVCLMPAAGGTVLDCRAREIQAETCSIATAMLQAGMASDRVSVIAACVPTITRESPLNPPPRARR